MGVAAGFPTSRGVLARPTCSSRLAACQAPWRACGGSTDRDDTRARTARPRNHTNLALSMAFRAFSLSETLSTVAHPDTPKGHRNPTAKIFTFLSETSPFRPEGRAVVHREDLSKLGGSRPKGHQGGELGRSCYPYRKPSQVLHRHPPRFNCGTLAHVALTKVLRAARFMGHAVDASNL